MNKHRNPEIADSIAPYGRSTASCGILRRFPRRISGHSSLAVASDRVLDPTRNKSSEAFLLFLRGMLMGIADAIPGVSGGTIAFITGIYHRLLHAINSIDLAAISSLFVGDWRRSLTALKKIDYSFLIPLLLGIGTALFFFSRVISFLLEEYPAATFSFFAGLIIGSAFLLIRQVGKIDQRIAFSLLGGFVVAFLLASATTLAIHHGYLVTFLSGAVAISAMILPGISGAFILLLLNQYAYILEAIHQLQFSVLAVFGLGALVGLFSFSKLLDFLLHHYRRLVFAFLIGLMLGSLRLPYREILQNGGLPLTILPSVLFGFFLVFILERFFLKKTH